jgi:hypothetical protein
VHRKTGILADWRHWLEDSEERLVRAVQYWHDQKYNPVRQGRKKCGKLEYYTKMVFVNLENFGYGAKIQLEKEALRFKLQLSKIP